MRTQILVMIMVVGIIAPAGWAQLDNPEATYPAAVFNPPAIAGGSVATSTWANRIQNEIAAVESELGADFSQALIVSGTENIVTVSGDTTVTGYLSKDPTNQIFGAYANTHVNLGSAGSITGQSGNDNPYCTVGGGFLNNAGAAYSVVAGGQRNWAYGAKSFVGSGGLNKATGKSAAVVAGDQNETGMDFAFVGAGHNNYAQGMYSVVAGGQDNEATGFHSSVLGGYANLAQGQYSLAAGNQAQALHDGSVVFADSTDAPFASTDVGQFLIRAAGNVGINTSSPAATLDVNGAIRVGGTAPSGPTDDGVPGEIRVADGYLYICIAANQWGRVELTW